MPMSASAKMRQYGATYFNSRKYNPELVICCMGATIAENGAAPGARRRYAARYRKSY